MEQTIQQITQKPSLPIKTKIAAWLVIGGSIVSLIIMLIGQLYLFFVILIPLLVFLYTGFSLLKLKKWAWQKAVIFSILGIISLCFFCFSILGIVPDIGYCIFHNCYLGNDFVFNTFLSFTFVLVVTFVGSLILLLLDRKNFFKIAS